MSKASTKLPPLPSEVPSILGAVSVTFMSSEKATTEKLCGQFNYDRRTIEISPDLDRRIEWATLWHETVHAVLSDSGASRNILSEAHEELVCDAIGAFLTACMMDGSLSFKPQGVGKAQHST